MRRIAYMIAHYGKAYIPFAIRSVYNQVDKIIVLYTPHPSHNHTTDVPPIESEQEIAKAAFSYNPQSKVIFHKTEGIRYEGPQRDYAVDMCRRERAKIVLVVDCDEIWNEPTLEKAFKLVEESNKARQWLVNMTHLWRSFNWCCRDQGWPIRFLDLRHKEGIAYVPREYGEVFHFGYAVTDKVLKYKIRIHGHKNEFRKNWVKDKWEVWPPPEDCHPTNDKNFWMPEKFDKNSLPEFMRQHPFWGETIIK